MKKKLLVLVTLFITLYSVAYSQISKSIIDTTKVWSYVVVNGTASPNIPIHYRYEENRIGEEVIVNDTVYRRIFSYGIDCLIREENGVVYSRRGMPYYNEVDYVGDVAIYNFNFNVGDSMNYYLNDHGTIIPFTFYVYRVDSINIDNTWLKRIYFDDGDIWIEGIGSMGGFNRVELAFTDGGAYEAYTEYKLTCLHQNDELMYVFNNNYPECGTRVGLNDIQDDDFSVNIYPSIVDDYLNIESSVYPLQIRIIDIFGREVYGGRSYGKNVINCKSFNNGVYYFISQNKNKKIKTCKFVVSK